MILNDPAPKRIVIPDSHIAGGAAGAGGIGQRRVGCHRRAAGIVGIQRDHAAVARLTAQAGRIISFRSQHVVGNLSAAPIELIFRRQRARGQQARRQGERQQP